MTSLSTESTSKGQLYGSVTASEIAQQIRNSLSTDPETAKIPIDEHSIVFRSQSGIGEQRRLKEVGDFDIDVLIPGSDSVSCVIRVVPEAVIEATSKKVRSASSTQDDPAAEV